MKLRSILYHIACFADRAVAVICPWLEIRRLRRLNEEHSLSSIERIRWEPGKLTVELHDRLLQGMAQSMAAMLDYYGAQNLVEFQVLHPTKEPLVLSVVRKNGKSPMDQVKEALKQLGEAEAAAVLLRDAIRDHKRRVRESSPGVADEILWKVLGEEDSKDGRGRRREHELAPPDSVSQLGPGR